ncbi:GAF and ANTAR domain-containing protein [Streptomyces longisporoflavus]|uniref:GAF and ANTAR domain-containing protein n=1 Tax=Streptomyces longisporoflavus TaxID=28044 RepID=A0ABW7QQK7_9ACTN
MTDERPFTDDQKDDEKEDVARYAAALQAAAQEPDPLRRPAVLCELCVHELDLSGSSITVSDGSDRVRATWWSSDPVAGRLAETQYNLGDGPCRTALTLNAPVLVADLARGPDARRWPVFAQQAVELGVRAVYSLPLGSAASVIGTLDLYSKRPGLLSERSLRFGLLIADAITLALIEAHVQSREPQHEPPGHRDLTSWLEGAEVDHTEIHQATGVIMYTLELDAQQALARLRAHAFSQGQSLGQVARDVILRRVVLDE